MPDDTPIDDRLKRFIAQNIASVEQLEILLLLSGDPSKTWTVNELFRAIQSNEESIARRVKGMCESGLLELAPQARYRFKPVSQDVEQCVTALDEAYRKSRVKVIEAIFADPEDQAKDFAAAFRIKKET